jgi:phosphate butyryltransferase
MITENYTFEELEPGQEAELTRVCTQNDFLIFANASGNHNPLHLFNYDGDGDGRAEAVAPALWVGSLISAVLGNILPGAGTSYRKQNFEFLDHAQAGDELVSKVRVLRKMDDGQVEFETTVTRKSDGARIVKGTALVDAPAKKLSFDEVHVPGLVVQRHQQFETLLEKVSGLPPMRTAVVAPEEPNSLGGALLARAKGVIEPVLVGHAEKIRTAAEALGEDISGLEMIDARVHSAAAELAVDTVNSGKTHSLMKGHLHTDELLRAALRKTDGLRAGRRFTHVFVMDVPGITHPLLVTDAAINIAPDLATKVDIVQNAIDLAISLGIAEPKVGILSAVETVNTQIPSSVDAALLSKMAERGQITGGLVDGPLAMDNAVDLAAAQTKGIASKVAGRAEILVAPNLDAGNMIAKQLTYIAGAEGAGVVLGAKVPIILTSRADGDEARLASCAVAALHDARLKTATNVEQATE